MAQNPGSRQEVFNTVLAQLLSERGLTASPENVQYGNKKRQMPDVLFDYAGLLTAIECEVDDQPKASEKALTSARKRIEDGLSVIGIALIYPAALRSLDPLQLKQEMTEITYQVAVVTEAGEQGYIPATLEELAHLLRNTFDQLVKEDVVTKAVSQLEFAIERFAQVTGNSQGIVDRLAETLGINPKTLDSKQRKEATRVSGLVLLNALIFQEVLSEHNGDVVSLNRLSNDPQPLIAFSKHWKFILDNINYYPIFILREKFC